MRILISTHVPQVQLHKTSPELRQHNRFPSNRSQYLLIENFVLTRALNNTKILTQTPLSYA